MRKLLLIIVLVLSACAKPVEEVKRLTVEELKVLLKDTSADGFTDDVSSAYSLFPIAFADSNGDGKGDLQGIINQLDYLNDNNPETNTDLGIDAVWLNPIYPSDTYHKYDINDYKAIDPAFGTIDDFKNLITEANKRGIKIILDMVFNHTSDTNPWFLKAIGGVEPFDEYYHVYTKIKLSDYPGSVGWYGRNSRMYYAGFWIEMPDLNLESELVRNELKSVLDFWLDLGVSGFRFDAAQHVYDPNEYPKGTNLMVKNKQFWMEMKNYVKSKSPDTYLVAEIWESTSSNAPYAPGFDSLFNFELAGNIVAAVMSGNSSKLLSSYQNAMKILGTKTDHYTDAIFLTNHDQDRIMSQLDGDVDKAKLAANILFTMPGIPFIYYGEELGMQGIKPDEYIREPFIWDGTLDIPNADWEVGKYNLNLDPYSVQVSHPDSMFNTYRTLIALRKGSQVLRYGDFVSLDISTSRVIAYSRTYNSQKWIILHNLNSSTQTVSLSEQGTIIYQHKASTFIDGVIELSPQSTLIIEVN